MNVVQGEEKEKWLLTRLINEPDRLPCEPVGHFLVNPPGHFTTCHISNPADAVHYGHVMAMAGFHFQQIRPGLSRRFLPQRFAIGHGDRVAWVKIFHHAIAHIDTGHTVPGCRH